MDKTLLPVFVTHEKAFYTRTIDSSLQCDKKTLSTHHPKFSVVLNQVQQLYEYLPPTFILL